MPVRVTDRRSSAFRRESAPETMLSAYGNSVALPAVEECRKIHRPPEYSGRSWHVLSVPTGCEEAAEHRLRELRIPGYFPRIRCREQRWGGAESPVFFPGLLFAALREADKPKLVNSFFIEEMREHRSDQEIALLQADIQFMVFAEKLNCFYPFQNADFVPPPPARGVPGCDFAELRGEHDEGYILLLPGQATDQVFFRFDSINRKIAFEIPKNLLLPILNLS